MERHGDKAPRPAAGFHGIPGFQQLDRRTWPTWRKALLVLAVCTGAPLLLFALFGNRTEEAFALYFASGFNNGLLLVAWVYSVPHIQHTMEDSLAPIDPRIQDYAVHMRPHARAWIGPLVAIFVIHGTLALSARLESGASVMRFWELDASAFVFYYGVTWIAWAGAGLALASAYSTIRYLRYVAEHVEIDPLRIDQYACLTMPALWALGVGSLLIGALGSAYLFVPEALQPTLAVWMLLITFGFIGTCMIAFAPVVTLRNRVADVLDADRERLREVLAGQREAIGPLHLGMTTGDPTHADLVGHWMLIGSLPEWPIGPHVRKVVAFGVLPPFAWVTAAFVENTLF